MNTKKGMVLVFAIMLSAFQGIAYGAQTNNKISFYDVFSTNTLTNNLKQQINLNSFMIKDLSIQSESEVPKILIIHSHIHENYEMNKKTKQIGSVVDVGDKLTKVLEKNYKVSVLHDKGEYDMVNGKNKFRYSLHMCPKSLLIDIGNNKDILKEAINSIQLFSKVLADVLGLEKIK